MSKCEGCPIVSGECVGERPGHAFACGLKAGSPSQRNYVLVASRAAPPAVEFVSPPAAPLEYPSLPTQAATALAAAFRFARSGFQVAGRSERRRRRAICDVCPYYDSEQARCKKCGCMAALKPWSEAERCPDGRW